MVALAWILVLAGAAASLAGFVILVIAAFRVSVGWGLAVLFLSGLVIPLLIFMVKHWGEARTGFLVSLMGWLIGGVGAFLLVGAPATEATAELGDLRPPRVVERPTLKPPPPHRDEPHPQASGATASETPDIPEPEPTPPVQATGEGPAQEETTEQPAAIPFDELGQYIGRIVDIRLRDGTRTRVQLEAVTEDTLTVTQQMGGGAMSYKIRWDTVAEVRVP